MRVISIIFLTIFFSLSIFASEPIFFPTPQKVKWEGKISAKKYFKIQADGKVPSSTVREFRSYLRKWGFQEKEGGILFSLTRVPLSECEKVAIPPYQKKVFLEHSSLQTHFLKVTENKVMIKSAGEDGFFYALMTFKNLWEDAGEDKIYLFKADIVDYPVFPIRGVFEGGYGIWDLEGRLKILEWMGKVKLNFYLYGPKSDPKMRRRWRELYDDIELFAFKRMLEVAKRNHINFGYTIAPTLGMEYGSEEDFQTLLKKVRQLQSLGIKTFVLAFDDTFAILYNPRDRQKFANLGEAESYLANKIYQSLKNYDEEVVLAIVPEIYAGVHPMDYTNSLVEKLLPEIYIGWTGPEIGAPKLDAQDMQSFINFYKRQPSIGDNWGTLFPLIARSPEIHKYTTQFLVNPYNLISDVWGDEPLMLIEGASLAEFSWNPHIYNPDKIVDKLSKIYFKEESRDVFKMFMYKEFYDFSSGYPLKTDYLPPIERRLRNILEKKDEKELKKYVEETLALFEKMKDAPGLIQTGCYEKDIGRILSKRVSTYADYFEKLIATLKKVQEGINTENLTLQEEGIKTFLKELRGK